ncbi:MAG: glycosyltransferase family 2 protein [Actinobacteria bacterium]|nr:MAG: glycosyltransferase family 2 protein [Actinomycetota bacterium]
MVNSDTTVSIGLPVRNAGSRVADVVRSVLAQDHTDLELVISDNASTDDTEDVCRELAKSDSRIAYHRQPQNVGLLNNFVYVIGAATGTYFRWIGDDDRLEPDLVSRSLQVFAADPRLILVTTGISYSGPDGEVRGGRYHGTALGSDDPVERFVEMLRLLNAGHLMIDPLYGTMRRDVVAAIPRRNMLHEDEVFATKLALAGPWGHIPDVLAHRHWKDDNVGALGRLLDVPAWQWRARNALQARETLRWLRQVDLTDEQRRRAQSAVYTMYLRRQWKLFRRRSRKLVRMATSR